MKDVSKVPAVISTMVSAALDNPNLSIDRTFNVPVGTVSGSPVEAEDGTMFDANGLELNFNGACPYRHVARQKNSDGSYSYVPVLYCPVEHPDREYIETAKQLRTSSTTSNLFIKGGRFDDPRDAAYVAQLLAEEPLVAWIEYFEYSAWEAPVTPKWVGEPVADGTTLKDFATTASRNVRIRLVVEQS